MKIISLETLVNINRLARKIALKHAREARALNAPTHTVADWVRVAWSHHVKMLQYNRLQRTVQ